MGATRAPEPTASKAAVALPGFTPRQTAKTTHGASETVTRESRARGGGGSLLCCTAQSELPWKTALEHASRGAGRGAPASAAAGARSCARFFRVRGCGGWAWRPGAAAAPVVSAQYADSSKVGALNHWFTYFVYPRLFMHMYCIL